jgi:hypothetical protein
MGSRPTTQSANKNPSEQPADLDADPRRIIALLLPGVLPLAEFDEILVWILLCGES